MKNKSLIVWIVIAIVIVVGFLFRQSKPQPAKPSPSSDTNSLQFRVEASKTAVQPLIDKRVAALNQQSEMPTNADSYDWVLGQRTSWWGKPIDAKKFWAGRTVWLDSSAVLAANRLGRAYPPMPYEEPRFTNHSSVDEVSEGTVEGPNINYRFSDKESAFWDYFQRTHPKPPEELERKQLEVAKLVLGTLKLEVNSSISSEKGSLVSRALEAKYPSEIFGDDTLCWCYVSDRQKEYQAAINNGETDTTRLGHLMQKLAVDPKFVTNSPSEQQIQAMNAWKIAYLQRLRKENKDQSYIDAYLKAWNLTAGQVFPPGNQ